MAKLRLPLLQFNSRVEEDHDAAAAISGRDVMAHVDGI